MSGSIFKGLMAIGVVAVSSPSQALPADDEDGQQIISLQLENDLFFGFTDQEYTNGFRLNYIYAPNKVPGAVEDALSWIPFFPKDGEKRFSLAFGQNIYTPSDIEVAQLLSDDRAYAGYMYLGFGVASQSDSHLDVLELDIGIVGPAALGEPVQRFVHEYISDSPEPLGWDNQLKNEPTFVIHYQRLWHPEIARDVLGAKWDFSPHVGVSVGTVFNQASVGGTLRLGTDLNRDAGAPPRIQPNLPGNDRYRVSDQDAFYVFMGAEARGVASNIFLDGGVFRSGQSVDRNILTGEIYFGAVLFVNDWKLTYTQVFRTDEYSTQQGGNSYGGFMLAKQF